MTRRGDLDHPGWERKNAFSSSWLNPQHDVVPLAPARNVPPFDLSDRRTPPEPETNANHELTPAGRRAVCARAEGRT